MAKHNTFGADATHSGWKFASISNSPESWTALKQHPEKVRLGFCYAQLYPCRATEAWICRGLAKQTLVWLGSSWRTSLCTSIKNKHTGREKRPAFQCGPEVENIMRIGLRTEEFLFWLIFCFYSAVPPLGYQPRKTLWGEMSAEGSTLFINDFI